MPYFDYNATAPLHPVAREAWLKAADGAWQNPGGPYRSGARAHAVLDRARERLAGLLGCRSEGIVFTSGATESDNAVISGVAASASAEDRIVVSPTEHPAVIESARAWWGERIVWLEVDGEGRVDEGHLERTLSNVRPRLVCLMAANNETGVVAPVERLAGLCHRYGAPMLCDATQWVGKGALGALRSADYLVGGAHKFGGPKGVGFVRLPEEGDLPSWMAGGKQENAHRAGTENCPSIAAMVELLAHLTDSVLPGEVERKALRHAFEARIAASIPGIRIVAKETDRLWNTVCLIMPRGENSWWAQKLDMRGFQVATGSACGSGEPGPSHVLSALGYEAAEARRMIRISSGWSTTAEDWNALADSLSALSREQASGPVIRTSDPKV